ncbi:hypothetical protein C7271_20960 [filamentous cyanobacterium CCP5]|nr:hypothetical protein C7271_20960 [filamentous cyanobacterium CCP5]
MFSLLVYLLTDSTIGTPVLKSFGTPLLSKSANAKSSPDELNINYVPVVIMSASQMTKSLLQKSTAVRDQAAAADFSLLRAVIEGFSDGILILSVSGQPLHINRRGLQLCRQISPDGPSHQVPEPLWTLCRYLIESEDIYTDRPVVLSNTILTPVGAIRARVQWYQAGDQRDRCLMVTLEDQVQAAKTAALFEARQFSLTERETEVWVLRKANRSYEEIAQELYIAVNTVKRHLKSIYAKRKQVEDLAEA